MKNKSNLSCDMIEDVCQKMLILKRSIEKKVFLSEKFTLAEKVPIYEYC